MGRLSKCVFVTSGHHQYKWKYYCGGKNSIPCPQQRCDTTCGPNNGCNCESCTQLEIKNPTLPMNEVYKLDPEVEQILTSLRKSAIGLSKQNFLKELELTLAIQSSMTEFNEEDVCIICLAAPKTMAFVHGDFAHQACCQNCATEVVKTKKECPICRQQISACVRVVK